MAAAGSCTSTTTPGGRGARVDGPRPPPTTTPAGVASAANLLGRFHAGLADLGADAVLRDLARLPRSGTPARDCCARSLPPIPAAEPRAWRPRSRAAFAAAPLAGDRGRSRRHVPRRVAHNDAKLDNVLFRAGEAVCLVDLDTVMPSAWFWDVGDLLRTASTHAAEDDPRPGTLVSSSRRAVSLDTRRLPSGSSRRSRPRPRRTKRWNGPGAIVTYEQALRFLTDWIAGDVYYRTSRPGQNLDRARAQLGSARVDAGYRRAVTIFRCSTATRSPAIAELCRRGDRAAAVARRARRRAVHRPTSPRIVRGDPERRRRRDRRRRRRARTCGCSWWIPTSAAGPRPRARPRRGGRRARRRANRRSRSAPTRRTSCGRGCRATRPRSLCLLERHHYRARRDELRHDGRPHGDPRRIRAATRSRPPVGARRDRRVDGEALAELADRSPAGARQGQSRARTRRSRYRARSAPSR